MNTPRPGRRSRASRRFDAVVVGGSIAGLGVALSLCRDGLKVACVERDATPMPDDHLAAWGQWRRDGAAQTRHSHVLLAPLVNSLREREPRLFDILLAAGAEILTFKDIARNTFEAPVFVPSDDEIRFLACRRVVFEFLLRRYLLDTLPTSTFEFIQADVRALSTVAEQDGRRATGVVAKTQQGTFDIDAEIVIDASGRNTRADRWLAAQGVQPATLEEQPCGIFYTSRFYRLKDGASYPRLNGRESLAGGVAGVDLGYLKAGIFRSDNRTFSITLAADPDDAPMRPIARDREFDLATRVIEATRPWVDNATSEPISKVYLYGTLANSRRRYWLDGRPVLSGFFAIGDAGIHTNPIAGRGCALGWMSALDLAESLTAETDPVRRAAAFEEHNEGRAVPWYEQQVRQDSEALAINKALQRGEDPFDFIRADGSIDEHLQRRVILRKGLRYAAEHSIEVLRLLFRQVNLLDPPGAATKRPDLAGLIFEGYRQSMDDSAVPRPLRSEFLEAIRTT